MYIFGFIISKNGEKRWVVYRDNNVANTVLLGYPFTFEIVDMFRSEFSYMRHETE